MDALRPRSPGQSDQGKIVTAAEAVVLIRDGDTVATSGFVGIGYAEEIAIALERRRATIWRARLRRAIYGGKLVGVLLRRSGPWARRTVMSNRFPATHPRSGRSLLGRFRSFGERGKAGYRSNAPGV